MKREQKESPPTPSYRIICQQCREILGEGTYEPTCPLCGGPLNFEYLQESKKIGLPDASMWRYRAVLPVRPESEVVTLGEGYTPLQKSRHTNHCEVYVKNECLNPTGSHKDRALSIGLTKGLEFGYDTVMLYSDGSAALSSAAYAARAQCRNIAVLSADTPDHRAVPLAFYNSIILRYEGPSPEAVTWVNQACRTFGLFETTTYRRANPYQAEGPKTIGLEIFEQLGRVPDWVVVPLGGGGTLAGIWRAFVGLKVDKETTRLPHMVGVLPAGYTRLALALDRGICSQDELDALEVPAAPVTIQIKIAMSEPPDGIDALEAIRESSGRLLFATDPEAVEAQQTLGSIEGIFAEPSASVAWVGVEKLLLAQEVHEGETVIAVVTGSGFRELQAASPFVRPLIVPVTPASGFSTLERLLQTSRSSLAESGN